MCANKPPYKIQHRRECNAMVATHWRIYVLCTHTLTRSLTNVYVHTDKCLQRFIAQVCFLVEWPTDCMPPPRKNERTNERKERKSFGLQSANLSESRIVVNDYQWDNCSPWRSVAEERSFFSETLQMRLPFNAYSRFDFLCRTFICLFVPCVRFRNECSEKESENKNTPCVFCSHHPSGHAFQLPTNLTSRQRCRVSIRQNPTDFDLHVTENPARLIHSSNPPLFLRTSVFVFAFTDRSSWIRLNTSR